MFCLHSNADVIKYFSIKRKYVSNCFLMFSKEKYWNQEKNKIFAITQTVLSQLINCEELPLGNNFHRQQRRS